MTTFTASIYYANKAHGRDLRCGDFFLIDTKMIEKTHTRVTTLKLPVKSAHWAEILGEIYIAQQGENWGQDEGVQELIKTLDLDHTSMSVGDVIQIRGAFFAVDRIGFINLETGEKIF